MVSSISPLNTYKAPESSLSHKTVHVAGILTTVFGLDELPDDASEVVCLWLMHPRLDTKEDMAGVATTIVDHWNRKSKSSTNGKRRGLIAVTFDARNHGTRLVDPLSNETWRTGNERHAQDMFSVYSESNCQIYDVHITSLTSSVSTARDVSLLIDYLPGYIFPTSERTISTHFVLGVSLGGHAAWNCLLHEPRITAGVVVVGMPDYVNLMADRARLSKLSSWTKTDPPGINFLGSQHFPTSLLETVSKYDPAAFLLGNLVGNGPTKAASLPDLSPEEKEQVRPRLNHLKGKRILNLSGTADKLVPYRTSDPFLSWLKRAVAPDGWFGDGCVHLEDLRFEGTAHDFTPAMMSEVLRFVDESMTALDAPTNAGTVREAKI
jgi:pimeloyl-ACP methyl ester carboxylesterase